MEVKTVLEHPEIECIVRSGYPSWMREEDDREYDSDRAYEESREKELFGGF